MNYRFTPYRHGDESFREVERFLSESVHRFKTPRNWFIDRWNFTYSVSRIMHKATIPEWEAAIGLWRDETGRIVALAHEEEQRGDVFFEFDAPETAASENLLGEMFSFAERACVKKRETGTGFALRIPQDETLAARMAGERGYRKQPWSEPLAARTIDAARNADRETLPEGLTMIEGSRVTPGRKALAHARAFGYADRKESIPVSELAFTALLETPSYRPELDLAYADARGDIVCFVGLWHDPVSKVGILEPVGTVPEYRRMGLAKRLIDEGERRLTGLGAKTLYVGSDQDFYRAIGFEVIARQDLWEFRSPE